MTKLLVSFGIVPACLLIYGLSETAVAQSVEFFGVSKEQDHVQTSATHVELDSYKPFYFGAGVFGDDLESIAAPTVTGPFSNPEPGHNGGVLGYNAEDGSWEYGWPGFGGWQTETKAEMDGLFGNGTYTFTVLSAIESVSLVGDVYPSAPLLMLSGGAWSGSTYVIAPGVDLTITTSDYSGYGTHAEDVIHLNMYGPGYADEDEVLQFASQTPEPWVSATYAAETLVDGAVYETNAGFGAVVDFRADIAGLPGVIMFASFETSTTVHILVSDMPGCNAADIAQPFGLLDLADIIGYVNAFGTMDSAADLAEPFGLFDLADVLEFVTVFSGGCP